MLDFIQENFWLLVLSLLSMSPGGGSAFQTDLLAVVTTEKYLEAHQVEMTPERLLEIVKKTPAAPRDTATQLLAIRWFGENPEKFGEHKKAVVESLQALSKGPPGFARDYVLAALARIDGKVPPPAHLIPKDSARTQAFEWFPDDVTLLAAIDLRAAAGQRAPEPATVAAVNHLQKQFLAVIPDNALPALHGVADALGNVRVDRIAFGYAPDPTDKRRQRFLVRMTGQGDAKRLAELIKGQSGAKQEDRQGPNGIAIRVLLAPRGPAMAFIGDSDFVICGYESGDDSGEVLDQVLAVLKGKKASAAKGPLAETLRSVPEDARAVVVGALPEEFRREFGEGPLALMPKSVLVYLSPTKDGNDTELRLRASFENEADAKKAVEGVKTLLKQGIDGLTMLPIKAKPEAITTLQKALESVSISAEGSGATASARLTPATLRALGDLFQAAREGLK